MENFFFFLYTTQVLPVDEWQPVSDCISSNPFNMIPVNTKPLIVQSDIHAPYIDYVCSKHLITQNSW